MKQRDRGTNRYLGSKQKFKTDDMGFGSRNFEHTRKSYDLAADGQRRLLENSYEDGFAPVGAVAKLTTATSGAIKRFALSGGCRHEIRTLQYVDTMYVEWRLVLDHFGEVKVVNEAAVVTPHHIPEYDYTEMLSDETRARFIQWKAENQP